MACVAPIYVRKYALHVPCGKCGACIKRNISDWVVRLGVEWKNSDACYFVTLTYEEDPLQLYKYDVQNFFKRCRKVGFKFSYFALGDYGDTYGRPHYHVLFFSKGYFVSDYLWSLWISGSQIRRRGFVSVSSVTMGRIAYVVRYGILAKLDWDRSDQRVRPFFLMSKRPALGSGYLSPAMRFYHRNGDKWYFSDNKWKHALPRYYRDKLFHDYERRSHADSYLSIADEKKALELAELAVHHSNPDWSWHERRLVSAKNFLDKLRFQKMLKNQNL